MFNPFIYIFNNSKLCLLSKIILIYENKKY